MTRYFNPAYLVPGKDHRRTIGKATFKGKGLGSRCTSIAYWGIPIPRYPGHDVMTALNSLTRAMQGIGYHLGIVPPTTMRNVTRPAVFVLL